MTKKNNYMRAYKAIKDLSYNLTSIKKGERLIEKPSSSSISIVSFQPEHGGYPFSENQLMNTSEFKRINDVPYSAEYYVNKNELKRMKTWIKNYLYEHRTNQTA